MKSFNLILLLVFFSVTTMAADTVLTNNKLVTGQKSSSAIKSIEFENNLGTATNAKITSLPASNDITLKSTTVKVGSGSAADQTLIFDRGSSNAAIKYNNTSSRLQSTNDGSNYYDIQNIKPNGQFVSNLSLATSVGSSALTISLKTAAGSNASATDPIQISFRNATVASGDLSLVSVTGALSVTVSSGSTLGHASALLFPIYVYLINNAGTAELAVSTSLFDEWSVISTTAEGGAGAADSASVMYSTTARSSVAFRLIGKLFSNQTTAGTWAAVPTYNMVGGYELARANFGVVSSGINYKIEAVSVATVCSASPCTISRQTGGITSIDRTVTGEYTINFAANTWLSTPTCTCSNTNGPGNGFYCPVRNQFNTTTQVFLVSINSSAAAADSIFDVICVGVGY